VTVIKAVVFDFGGVLVRTENAAGRRQWEARLGLGTLELDRLIFDSDIALRATAGDGTEAAVWEHVASTLKLNTDQLAALQRDFWAGDNLDQNLTALLASLRPRYTTAILSNAWSNGRDVIVGRYGMASVVDTIIISAEERLAKPDRRLFQLTAERLGAQPAEAVFVDDYLPNVEGARAAGWQAIHFQAGLDVRAELEKLGVVTRPKYPPA
jgi:epoxide hydrolase-like predicted phosphatase